MMKKSLFLERRNNFSYWILLQFRNGGDFTKIKFENGSEISSVNGCEDNKRGYIRGRRLTDKEYQYMLMMEEDRAQERVDKMMKILGLK